MIKINITKKIQDQDASRVLTVDIEIEKGETLIITGDSGIGKTTLLKMITGLIKPDKGAIVVNGCTWLKNGASERIPSERNVTLLQQDYPLFNHMTVYEQLHYLNPSLQSADVENMLVMIGLKGIASKYPTQLSGGQRQRVAIMAACLQEVDLVCLDEPFSALDVDSKAKVLNFIKMCKAKSLFTLVIVSHDESFFQLEYTRRLRMVTQDSITKLEASALISDYRPSIEHIAIYTQDLEKMQAFYITYFKATSGKLYQNSKNGFSSYFLEFNGGSRLELMHKTSIKDSPIEGDEYLGWTHIAINLGAVKAVDEMTDVLRTDGFQIIGEPRRTGDGYYESVILDPEGNRVELLACEVFD